MLSKKTIMSANIVRKEINWSELLLTLKPDRIYMTLQIKRKGFEQSRISNLTLQYPSCPGLKTHFEARRLYQTNPGRIINCMFSMKNIASFMDDNQLNCE